MQKKKVLEVVEAFGGGVFTMINDLTNELSNKYEIVIAYQIRPQTPKEFKKMFNKNIRFIEVKNFTRNLNPIKDIKAFIELKKIIKKEKPEIIHLHSSKSGVIGRLAASGNKYKMIYNPHGFSFLKLDDSKLKRTLYKIIEKIMAILNPKCIIVGCSKGEYEEAKKISNNVMQIDNSINIKELEEYINTNKKIDLKNLKICTIGRIGYQKNPKEFNKIAELLPNFQFTWIGDGELKKDLKSKNIKITGWKNRKEVLKLIQNQDIFILTSLWEGLPITLLEAGYMKKLCIVSNVIGNKDVIHNKKDGYIYNSYTEIKEIIDNLTVGKYEKLSTELNKKIKKQFNIDLMLKKYNKLYKNEENNG